MESWLALDRDHAWHPYTQHGCEPEPLAVAGARGAWLELADGRRLLDGISSWWCCLHGHGHPRLVAALREQAERLDHVLFAGCTHEPAARLAAELVRMTAPLARDGARSLRRVFYSDDGSTAVEVALKMAYGCWLRRGEPARTVFVALAGGYHGDTFGAMAAGDPQPFFADYAPFLFQVVRVGPSAAALAAALAAHRGRVAAFLLEPLLQGAAGMVPHPAAFVREARRLCDEHGVLLIADEVMTGFGRTGRVFACEHAGVCPDLLCLGKGLTGGMLPLAATLASEEIYRCFLGERRDRALFHGHTFTANPLGCAVARASLALVREEDVPARLDGIGRRLEARLADLRAEPRVAELRRTGGVVAVELAAPDSGYLAACGERLRAACRALAEPATGPGVLLRPLGNVLYAMPPACLDDEEVELLASALRAAIMAA